MHEHIGREHPAEGVFVFRGQPTIVFLTVCSWKRQVQLANSEVHNAMVASWQKADAWMVGFYMVMPDHLHLFCSPKNEKHRVEQWVTFWKRLVRRQLGAPQPLLQAHSFHRRLRRDENYSEKWEYVRLNPVRAGLVSDPDEWPYQGVLSELRW